MAKYKSNVKQAGGALKLQFTQADTSAHVSQNHYSISKFFKRL